MAMALPNKYLDLATSLNLKKSRRSSKRNWKLNTLFRLKTTKIKLFAMKKILELIKGLYNWLNTDGP